MEKEATYHSIHIRPYNLERVKAMYLTKKRSLDDIAAHFNTNPARIRQDLLAEGITMELQGRRVIHRPPPREELEALVHARGLSQAKAAKEYGISKHTFQNWLKKRGLSKSGRL